MHLPTKWLKCLSTACLVAGVLLVLSPFVEELYTGAETSRVQTEALSAWDRGIGAGTSPNRAGPRTTSLVLTIPRLGIRRLVPDGATPEHLRAYGIGWISWTAPPDAQGILGIAGHRTTYGAPLRRIDELRTGDSILVDYRGQRYTYEIIGQRMVRPQQVDVLEQRDGHPKIALITCAPPYSAAFRLVVFGRLQGVSELGRR